MTIELFGDPDRLVHLLTLPEHFAAAVRTNLLGVIPGVAITPVKEQGSGYPFTNRVHAFRAGVTLWLDRADISPKPDFIAGLLNGFRELGPEDALIAQFVLQAPPRLPEHVEDDRAFNVLGRLAAAASSQGAAQRLVLHAMQAYSLMGVEAVGELAIDDLTKRSTPYNMPNSLSAAALAMLTGLPVDSPQVAGLQLGTSRRLPPPSSIPSAGIRLAKSNYDERYDRPLALPIESFMRHLWVLGPTGSGKSTALHHIATQVMEQGHGLVLIEPKGDLARMVLESVPEHRAEDVIWFDPSDDERPIGFNVLAGGKPDQIAGYLSDVLLGMQSSSTGARMSSILRHAILTAASQGLTLYGVKRLLTDRDYRAAVVRNVSDFDLRQFWDDFEDMPAGSALPVLSRLDSVLASPTLRNIVGQTGGLDIADVVRQQKILLVPLGGAELGDINAKMLGTLLTAELWQQILLRPEELRKPIVLMLDEFQDYVELMSSLDAVLDKGRSYKFGAVLANQRVGQLPEKVLDPVLANAMTKMVFGVKFTDASKLYRHFPPLTVGDFQSLRQYEVVLQAHTPSGPAPTTTGETYPPPPKSGFGEIALEHSRAHYGRDRAEVEAALRGGVGPLRPTRPAFGKRPKSASD